MELRNQTKTTARILWITATTLCLFYFVPVGLLMLGVFALSNFGGIARYIENSFADSAEKKKRVRTLAWACAYIALIDLPFTFSMAKGYTLFLKDGPHDYTAIAIFLLPAGMQLFYKPPALALLYWLKKKDQISALWSSMGLLFLLNLLMFLGIMLWR